MLDDRAVRQQQIVRAGYLIAGDGNHSPIRPRVGIGVDGPGQLLTTITAIVEADLNPALRGRKVSIAYLQQPQPFTILMAHDDQGRRWVFTTGYDSRHTSPEDFTDDRVADLVRSAAGLPEVAVTLRPQVPGTDLKVLAFPRHPGRPQPGLETPAVVKGTAGAGLLDTFDQERRPIGLLTMGQALARFASRMAPGQGPAVLDDGAVALGYQYRSSAMPGATDPDPRPLPPVALTGQPGSRAPTFRSPWTTARSPPWTCTGEGSCCWPASTGPGGRRPRPACRSGPARRLRRLAQHRPAPRTHHRARGSPPRQSEHPKVAAEAPSAVRQLP